MAKGYFVISDISGYTNFLNNSELEHANDIIKGIMETLSKNINAPLQISNFQGDAILTFAPEEKVIVGQTLIHQIDNLYFQFRSFLQKMHFNTTCECNACSNIPTLDLKFFVHYGEYAITKVAGREELMGPDVILVHRLMKNDVRAKTGKKAYTLYTMAAADRLSLQDYCEDIIPHEENLSDVGDIHLKVYCMHDAYKKELLSDKNRETVEGIKPWVKIEIDLDAPPNVVWDYLTKSDLKKQWLSAIGVGDVIDSRKDGKKIKGVGTKYHCAHEAGDIKYEVVDWRPFNYFTVDGSFMNGLHFRQMDVIRPKGDGSAYTVHLVPKKKNFFQGFKNNKLAKESFEMFLNTYDSGRKSLAKLIKSQYKESATT